MLEKNVGDISEICRKENDWKPIYYRFMGSSLPTINVGDFVGNHVWDIKGGKKRFGGDAKSGYSKAWKQGWYRCKFALIVAIYHL